MENLNQDIINALNELIILNNDRVEGYELAKKETNDFGLKNLFEQFSQSSELFASQLAEIVSINGGEAEQGTSTSGKFYRAWMEVKSAVTAKDRKGILNSCEYGEDVILEAYEDALNSEITFSEEINEMLLNHKAELQDSHDTIKSLRDSLVTA